MVVARLGRPASGGGMGPQSVRDLVLHWMQEWVWRGFPTDEAAQKTIEEVRAAGLVDEFVDSIGPMACQHFWLREQHSARNGRGFIVEDGDDAIESSVEDQHVAPEPDIAARRRDHVLAGPARASLFDWMMIPIDGKLVRIGDVRRSDAEAVAAGYAKRKAHMAGKEAIWTRIASELGDRAVRERYTEDDIRAILRGVAA